MPITYFHIGPALAAKAAVPKHVSFMAFAVTQVVIDAEVVFALTSGMWPVHRFFHTYLGATVIALATVIIGRPFLRWALLGWNRTIASGLSGKLHIKPDISLQAALLGALLGGWSHVLLDSFLYADMQPFAPFMSGNALLGFLSRSQVYSLCVVLGLLGAAVLLAVFLRRKNAF